ncbi:MAG: transglutaminase family protein [Actinomycetota bacterium]
MLFEGVHRTSYDYSAPVFLEPHVIRLRPRSDPRQAIHRFSLRISPEPDGVTEGMDVYGNDVAWAWFSGTHTSLEIITSFSVETLRDNPYDFVVPSLEAATIPPEYPDADRPALIPYTQPVDGSPGMLAKEIAASVDGNVVAFLREMASRIHATHEFVYRPDGDPWPPAVTLGASQGSCRDLAWLFVEACRTLGIAARFVSGYVADEPTGLRELHAWGAAYVPGAGWRGYDPALGLAVTDRHVTLAAAATPAGAAPVDGRFRGSGTAEMTSTIDLETRPRPATFVK